MNIFKDLKRAVGDQDSSRAVSCRSPLTTILHFNMSNDLNLVGSIVGMTGSPSFGVSKAKVLESTRVTFFHFWIRNLEH
jgi:hypothetical protein